MTCLRQSTRDVVAAGRASIEWGLKRPRSFRNREMSPSGLRSCRDGVLTAEAEVQVDRLASPNASRQGLPQSRPCLALYSRRDDGRSQALDGR